MPAINSGLKIGQTTVPEPVWENKLCSACVAERRRKGRLISPSCHSLEGQPTQSCDQVYHRTVSEISFVQQACCRKSRCWERRLFEAAFQNMPNVGLERECAKMMSYAAQTNRNKRAVEQYGCWQRNLRFKSDKILLAF